MASTLEINLANWRTHPANQTSFINISKILQTHHVPKSSNPSTFQQHPSPPTSLSKTFGLQTQDGATLDLPTALKASHTDGFLVLQHGKVVHEEYSSGNGPESQHILMSMSKSLTGLLVGILQAAGKLRVTDEIVKYIPEVAQSFFGRQGITIRQCLDMRSGAKYADETHVYRAAAGWNHLDGSEKYTNLHDFITNFEPNEILPADEKGQLPFEYSSVNTDLLGWVIERATGKKFAQVLQELLWEPMGAEYDALVAVDEKGNARAAGGVCASVRDVARVGELLTNSGKTASGKVVIPESWVEDMIRTSQAEGVREAFAKGAWAPGFAGTGVFGEMGYRDCWLVDEENEIVMGLGIFGQHLFADRKNGIVVVKTSSQEQSIDFGMVGLGVGICLEARKVLLESANKGRE